VDTSCPSVPDPARRDLGAAKALPPRC